MQVICKIIFESEKEKLDLMHERCPLAYKGTASYQCPYLNDEREDICEICWAESGIEMEVKENTNEDHI